MIKPNMMEMELMYAGKFTMGSPETEPDREDDETLHKVTLTNDFYMGQYPVNGEHYVAVMGPNSTDSYKNLPVWDVSWFEALIFCNKLSLIEELTPVYSIFGSTDPAAWGTLPDYRNIYTDCFKNWNAAKMNSNASGYRLPTEAEWEYACRMETKIVFGSVTEWCWDRYGHSYYSSSPEVNPEGPGFGDERVVRGWTPCCSDRYRRPAYRFYSPANFCYNFRLVRRRVRQDEERKYALKNPFYKTLKNLIEINGIEIFDKPVCYALLADYLSGGYNKELLILKNLVQM